MDNIHLTISQIASTSSDHGPPLSLGDGSYPLETTEEIQSHRRKEEKDIIKLLHLFILQELRFLTNFAA